MPLAIPADRKQPTQKTDACHEKATTWDVNNRRWGIFVGPPLSRNYLVLHSGFLNSEPLFFIWEGSSAPTHLQRF